MKVKETHVVQWCQSSVCGEKTINN